MYFRNLLWLSPRNVGFSKKGAVFNKFVDSLFLLFSYKELSRVLKDDFSFDLKLKRGLIQKLRRFSLISLFFSKKSYKRNHKKFFSLINFSLKPFKFPRLFSYSLKKPDAYSFIISDFFLML